jgi:hypothetical protein
MNKRPGHVKVTTEVAYCSVCGRSRNLRREEHQLGTFVRTVVTCETCHRTLSSTMGVAGVEEPAATLDVAAVEFAAPAAPKAPAARTAAPKPKPKPQATRARTTKPK